MEHNPDKKNKRNQLFKKLSFALPILFVGVMAMLMPTHAAHASIFGDIAYSVIGKIVFGIGWIVAWILGLVVGVEAWLIGVILNINDGVFQSPVVQTGFSATLSLANLGFVFGIIIIAIATILQSQTYGIKQTLWKLVVMAILVNFGLVIMGSIFNFADQFTTYFLACIDPTGGGCNSTQNPLTSENDFANNLAGAFNPQKGFLSIDHLNNSSSTSPSSQTVTLSDVGKDIGTMLTPIFSVFFIAGSLIVMVITLAAFVIMLLIRYVYIAILAVLLPFAWMLWIFPATKSHFDKWWKEFIRWTVFAPVSLFFIWLALATAHGLSGGTINTSSFATYTSTSSNPVLGAISNTFGNLVTPLITSILSEIVLVGLMVGGMIAANSFGIALAGGGIALMSNVGKWTGRKAGNAGKKAGRATMQKTGVTQKLQGSRLGAQLKKIPLIGGVAGGAVGRMESLAGHHLANVEEAGGKNLVAKEMETASKKDSARLAKELKGAMPIEKQLAHLQQLSKNGDLNMVEDIRGMKLADFMDKNEKTIQSYGQGKLASDVDTAMLSNKAMRDQQREINASGNDAARKQKATDALHEEAGKFVGGIDASKVSKMDMKMAFGENAPTEMSEAVMANMAEYQPRLVPNMMSKMKGGEFKNFTKKYGEILEKRIGEVEKSEEKELEPLRKVFETKKIEVEKWNEEIKKLKERSPLVGGEADYAQRVKSAEEAFTNAQKESANAEKEIIDKQTNGEVQQWRNRKESLNRSIANLSVFGAQTWQQQETPK